MYRYQLLLLCALSYFKTGSQYIVEIKPPRIIGETSGSKTVNSGENFELVCESDKAIHWFYPQLTMDMEILREEDYGLTSEVNIKTTVTRNGEHHSVFRIINACYLDTGYYYCIVNGTSDFSDALESVSQVYVYVADASRLLVQNESFVIQTVAQHQAAVIACRPTSLNVNVTLLKDGMVFHPGVHGEGVLNVTYDPTIGYILEPINFVHTGIFTCIASLGNVTEELHFSLDILKISNSIPKPSINGTYVRTLTAGEKLYLECVARASTGIKFNILWHWPKSVKDSRVKLSEELTPKNCIRDHSYSCSMRSLTIENVKLEERGSYTCEVIDHNQIKNNETKEIKIHEAGQSYINLTVDSEVISILAGADHVQWVVNVDATPMPSYDWFTPQQEQIKPKSSMKYDIIETESKTQVTLKIKNIRIQDAGVYAFEADNSGAHKKLNLTLVVNDKPAVALETNPAHEYYQLGMTYSIKCKIVGHPPPQIQWSFKECDLQSECEGKEFVQISNTSDPEIHNNQHISILMKEITTPGILKCFANNSQGNGSDVVSLFVTDIPDDSGFKIWGKPDKVVAGENMTLHCGSTKYNFTHDIKWYQKRIGYSQEQEVENASAWFVTRSDTEYSYVTTITWTNVLPKSDAEYICTATRKDDDLKSSLIQNIRVYDPVKPSFRTETNLNNSDWLLESGNSLDLQCQVDGLPFPSVLWYKNGALIADDQRISLRNNNQSLWIQFAKHEDEGIYMCEVSNRLDTIRKHINLLFKDKPETNIFLTAGITIITLILVILIAVLAWKIRREDKLRKELAIIGLDKFENGGMENINCELPVDDQVELLPYDKKWEFPRDKLKLGKQLGAGAFGVVLKAEAYGILEGEVKTTVAVKMVKRNTDLTYIKALASELKIMVHLGKHLNVVNLLGACTKSLTKMELLVIVEYCRFGNLHNYLLRHREDFVDQIDLKTGQIDPTIGIERLARTESIKSKSRLKYAALSFSSTSGERSQSHSGGMAVDYRAACARPGDRSPDITGSDIEANLISMTPTGEHDEFMLSNNSIQPEWRSNYRGDYKDKEYKPVCTRDLLCWAFQVARGMEYLASRKVMHGDLAARNILLADDNIVKICDFGLAKSMYKSDNYRKKGNGPLPVKWMAIESISDRVFSTQSDVWSFGIVLWEFFSLARTPYPGMEADEKLYNKLVDGYRMEQPTYATRELYNIMMKCWLSRPIQRPSFGDLAEQLGNMLEESVRRYYVDLNDPYMDMNALWMEGLQNDYLSMMNSPSYGNMVSPTFDDSDHEYINSQDAAQGVTSNDGESSGYLCMKSPTPEVIFSPRLNGGNVFSFSPHLQQQRRLRSPETEGTKTMEQKPMLGTSRNSSESDIEADHLGYDLSTKKTNEKLAADMRLQGGETAETPSFSNPSYQSVMPITPSADNYVNMPQQKMSKKINQSDCLNDNNKGKILDTCIPLNDFDQDKNTHKSENKHGYMSPHNGVKFQNSFSNPNYQSQIKTNNDTYANIPNHDRKTSDASSGFQSDVGDGVFVH